VLASILQPIVTWESLPVTKAPNPYQRGARGLAARPPKSQFPMNPKYIVPFVNAAVSTFDIMLRCQLTPLETFVKVGIQPEFEVSGIIGLSSEKARGTVVLSLSHNAAVSAAGAMLGEQLAEINADVIDAVGELTNIIAGSAKAKLEHLKLAISLPTTFVGKHHSLVFPPAAASVCIPYECPWGDVAVQVALVEDLDCVEPDKDAARDDRAAPAMNVPHTAEMTRA
jgi:chemotaxis protein CheX